MASNGKFRNRIVEYGVKPASQFTGNPSNWRRHPERQRRALNTSLNTVGWAGAVIESARSGYLIDGHERLWQALHEGDETPVPYLLVDVDPNEESLLLATLDPIGAMAETDAEMLAGLLAELGDVPEFETEDVSALLATIAADTLPFDDVSGTEKGAQPNPRQLPIDVIYTLQMADCTCCLAVQAGLKYGIQSAHYRLCPYTHELSDRHEVAFIDNDYFNYEHEIHLAAVRDLRPKYATVRDVMAREQCAVDNIAFYELDQILEWAEELAQYAENVIVIPKWDCIDRIPEQYVLGYSVPTSHGGTPIPVNAFRGRRVHLLGGSWAAQLSYMAALGDDVVSLDTNYVQRQARMLGAFCAPDGTERQMKEVGYGYLTNVRYAALALSFGAIGAKVNELYAGSARAPDPKARQSRTLPNKTRSLNCVPSNRCSRRVHRGANDGRYYQPAHRHDRGFVGRCWHAGLPVYVYAARLDAQNAWYSGGARARLHSSGGQSADGGAILGCGAVARRYERGAASRVRGGAGPGVAHRVCVDIGRGGGGVDRHGSLPAVGEPRRVQAPVGARVGE